MQFFTGSMLPEYRKGTGFRFKPVGTSTGSTGWVYTQPVKPVGRAIRWALNLQKITTSIKHVIFYEWPKCARR